MRADDLVAARDEDSPLTKSKIRIRRRSSDDRDDPMLSGWVFLGIATAIVALIGVLLWLVRSNEPGTVDASESTDISVEGARVPATITVGSSQPRPRPGAALAVQPGRRPQAGSVPATIASGTDTATNSAPTTVVPKPATTTPAASLSAGKERSKSVVTSTVAATSTTNSTATTVPRSTTTAKPRPVTEVRSTAVAGLRSPEAERPPNGICGAAAGSSDVTFRPPLKPGDRPRPGCAQALGTERIHLVNDGTTPWLVRLGRLDVTVLPGDSHLDTVPVSEFLAPGFHVGTGLGSLWLLAGVAPTVSTTIAPPPKCPRVEAPIDSRELASAAADIDGDGRPDQIRYLLQADGSATVAVELGDGGSLVGSLPLSILPDFIGSFVPVIGARDIDADGTLEVFASVGWDGVEQVDTVLRSAACSLSLIPHALQLPRLSRAGSAASYRCIPGGVVIVRAFGSPDIPNFAVVRAIHNFGDGGFSHRSTESANSPTLDFPGDQLGEPCF